MTYDPLTFFRAMLRYMQTVPGTERFAAVLGTQIPADKTGAGDALRPFVRHMPWAELASPASRPLVQAFTAAVERLPWTIPYAADAGAGQGFSEGAVASEHLGAGTTFGSGPVASGIFAVRPGVTYHDHAHQPVELYLPIAGRAAFWSETRGWRHAGPDQAIVHQPWEWHAMQTTDQPVLILWAWLGPDGIGTRPILRCEMAGLPVEAEGG